MKIIYHKIRYDPLTMDASYNNGENNRLIIDGSNKNPLIILSYFTILSAFSIITGFKTISTAFHGIVYKYQIKYDKWRKDDKKALIISRSIYRSIVKSIIWNK